MALSTMRDWLGDQRSMASRFFSRVYQILLREGLTALFTPLPSDPRPGEVVARFIFHRNQFDAQASRVKPRALEPASGDSTTSVFRVIRLAERSIWGLARRYIEPTRGPTLGRADFIVSAAQRLGLDVRASEPPPRHTVLSNWPAEKHARMSLAQRLAAEATLVVREAGSDGTYA